VVCARGCFVDLVDDPWVQSVVGVLLGSLKVNIYIYLDGQWFSVDDPWKHQLWKLSVGCDLVKCLL